MQYNLSLVDGICHRFTRTKDSSRPISTLQLRSRTEIWLVFQQVVGFPLFATEMQGNQMDRTELL